MNRGAKFKRTDEVRLPVARPKKRVAAPSQILPTTQEERENVIGALASNFEGRNRDKVMLTQLPPQLSASDFLDSLHDIQARAATEVTKLSTDVVLAAIRWMQLIPGRKIGSSASSISAATAYVAFASRAAASTFIKLYHGHSFIDSQGNEFRAQAGLALNQRMLIPVTSQPGHPQFTSDVRDHHGGALNNPFSQPQALRAIDYYRLNPGVLLQPSYAAPDRKNGTIESDPSYIAFLQSISAAKPPKASQQFQNAQIDNGRKDKNYVSPLVKALIEKRSSLGRGHSKPRKGSQPSLERRNTFKYGTSKRQQQTETNRSRKRGTNINTSPNAHPHPSPSSSTSANNVALNASVSFGNVVTANANTAGNATHSTSANGCAASAMAPVTSPSADHSAAMVFSAAAPPTEGTQATKIVVGKDSPVNRRKFRGQGGWRPKAPKGPRADAPEGTSPVDGGEVSPQVRLYGPKFEESQQNLAGESTSGSTPTRPRRKKFK